MVRCIDSLSDPEQAKENVFRSIEYALSQQFQEVKNSGFWYNIRGINPDWERIIDAVERQFKLA